MTNSNDKNPSNGQPPEHAIATSPQDLLNFLGFISKGTLIGAVTAAAIKDDLTKLVKALDDGQTADAKAHADQIRQGLTCSARLSAPSVRPSSVTTNTSPANARSVVSL